MAIMLQDMTLFFGASIGGGIVTRMLDHNGWKNMVEQVVGVRHPDLANVVRSK
jgi:hypothetical protein